MAEYAIIPDASCDLVKPLRERFGIDDYIKSIVYLPDGTCIPSDIDWETYNPKEFFESMKDKNISKWRKITESIANRLFRRHFKGSSLGWQAIILEGNLKYQK